MNGSDGAERRAIGSLRAGRFLHGDQCKSGEGNRSRFASMQQRLAPAQNHRPTIALKDQSIGHCQLKAKGMRSSGGVSVICNRLQDIFFEI